MFARLFCCDGFNNDSGEVALSKKKRPNLLLIVSWSKDTAKSIIQ